MEARCAAALGTGQLGSPDPANAPRRGDANAARPPAPACDFLVRRNANSKEMPPPRRKALLLLGPVLLAAALLPRPADAHGMMVIPESRNWKAYMAVTENCPHCLNGGGARMNRPASRRCG